MGQGIYTMIGYGAENIKLPVKDDGDVMELDEIFGSPLSDSLGQDCESEPNYLIIPIAISDKFLADCWKLECFARRCFAVHDLHRIYSAELLAAAILWKKAQNAAKKRVGLELPTGRLLIVSDYD